MSTVSPCKHPTSFANRICESISKKTASLYKLFFKAVYSKAEDVPVDEYVYHECKFSKGDYQYKYDTINYWTWDWTEGGKRNPANDTRALTFFNSLPEKLPHLHASNFFIQFMNSPGNSVFELTQDYPFVANKVQSSPPTAVIKEFVQAKLFPGKIELSEQDLLKIETEMETRVNALKEKMVGKSDCRLILSSGLSFSEKITKIAKKIFS